MAQDALIGAAPALAESAARSALKPTAANRGPAPKPSAGNPARPVGFGNLAKQCRHSHSLAPSLTGYLAARTFFSEERRLSLILHTVCAVCAVKSQNHARPLWLRDTRTYAPTRSHLAHAHSCEWAFACIITLKHFTVAAAAPRTTAADRCERLIQPHHSPPTPPQP